MTHALQQVEDWIQEIHRGVPNIPGWLQGSYTAEGMIVIGRSKDLTEEQRETLALKNAKSSIKILTYDDLLERLSRLIKRLTRNSLELVYLLMNGIFHWQPFQVVPAD